MDVIEVSPELREAVETLLQEDFSAPAISAITGATYEQIFVVVEASVSFA